jgi:hypothetical protein
MFHLKRFFHSTTTDTTENLPFLSSNAEMQLEEVVEETSLDKVDMVSISKPRHLKYLTPKPELSTAYDEIQLALTMLQESKKNFISYRTMQMKRIKFVGVYNIACLLTIPGISQAIMLKLHVDLSTMIWRKLEILKPIYEQACKERNTFMNWYNDKIHQLDQTIAPCKDPMNSGYFTPPRSFRSRHPDRHPLTIHLTGTSSHPCLDQMDKNAANYFFEEYFFNSDCDREHYIEMNSPHFSWKIPDYCAMNQIDYSRSICNKNLEYLCNSENKLLECMNEYASHLPEHQKLKDQFESQYVAHIAELNKNVFQVEGPRNALMGQSTWEPISTTVFSLSALTAMAAALYLGCSWRNAVIEYKNDLQGSHSLDEGLQNPGDMAYISNLTAKLKISLKNITLEKLIQQLEATRAKEQPKESRIAFFKAAHRAYLPFEITKKILEHAEMIRPRF